MIPRMFYGGHSVPYYQQQAVWDPFQEVPHGVSSLVATAPPAFSAESQLELTKLDWKETPEAHVFKAELPGLKKNEVKVEVEEGRVLCIRGEKSVEKEVSGGTWHRVERSSGTFVRRFRLPEDAKLDKLTACLERGVLTVTVPKKERKHQPKRTIQIHGQ